VRLLFLTDFRGSFYNPLFDPFRILILSEYDSFLFPGFMILNLFEIWFFFEFLSFSDSYIPILIGFSILDFLFLDLDLPYYGFPYFGFPSFGFLSILDPYSFESRFLNSDPF